MADRMSSATPTRAGDADLRAVLRRTLRAHLKRLLVLAAFAFVPAWTLRYPEAWTLLLIILSSQVATALYLFRRDPALLQRRQVPGSAEAARSERVVHQLASYTSLVIFAVSALDHSLGWSRVPPSAEVAGCALVILGYLIVFVVLRSNSFGAVRIEIATEHRVVSTGPYAIVRHPMYVGALVASAGVPLALGSAWGLVVVVLAVVPRIVWRILYEERFLLKNLAGYEAYRRQTRFRLIPLVW
jgi:protein-S-isoprenylcysteine O-methyltransferase Ste14